MNGRDNDGEKEWGGEKDGEKRKKNVWTKEKRMNGMTDVGGRGVRVHRRVGKINTMYMKERMREHRFREHKSWNRTMKGRFLNVNFYIIYRGFLWRKMYHKIRFIQIFFSSNTAIKPTWCYTPGGIVLQCRGREGGNVEFIVNPHILFPFQSLFALLPPPHHITLQCIK